MSRAGAHRPRGRRVLARLSLVLFFAGVRCASVPVTEGGDASLLSRLDDRSWIATEPARSFGPGNLYEEIDGEAELFLPYGFRELTVGIFRSAGNEKAEFRLELFRHATPRDAFGVFSLHRFPGQERIRLGVSEAVVSAASLDFFRGTHFVRIRAASRTASSVDLAQLGREISALLPGTGDPPRETETFRIPGLVDGSVVFHRRAILGYEALAPGYEARHEMRGTSGTLILLLSDDTGSASQFHERLSVSLPGFARADQDLFRADLPSGTLWLLSRNGYHLGYAGKANRTHAEAILSDLDRRAIPLISDMKRLTNRE